MRSGFMMGMALVAAVLTFPTYAHPSSFAEVFVRLSAEGLTTMSTQAEFRENDQITRGEAAKFISEYAQLKGLPKTYTDCTFSDLEGYDATLIPHIQEACAYGILKGSQGKFMPNDPITEAQGLAMIVRTLAGFKDETKTPWYADYFTQMNDTRCILMENETMASVESTPVTRGKLGTWLYMVAELESADDDMCHGKNEPHEDHVDVAEADDKGPSEDVEAKTIPTTVPQGYQDYTDLAFQSALAAHQKVVLFFRADRCPLCNALHGDLEDNMDAIPDDVVIFDIDYDTATELKKEYNVITQHTLVYFNAEGEVTDTTVKAEVTLEQMLNVMNK